MWCEHSLPDFTLPASGKRARTLSALIRLGFAPSREVSSRYITFGERGGVRLFVGRSGALRVGMSVKGSESITGSVLHDTLVRIGAREDRDYDPILDRVVPTLPSTRRDALVLLDCLGVRGGDERVVAVLERTLRDHAAR